MVFYLLQRNYSPIHAAPKQVRRSREASWLRFAHRLLTSLLGWRHVRHLYDEIERLEGRVSALSDGLVAAFATAGCPAPVALTAGPRPDLRVIEGGKDASQDTPGDASPFGPVQAGRVKRKPRRDPDAPHGRDENGEPIAKYGYRRDGRPRATKPRTQARPTSRPARPEPASPADRQEIRPDSEIRPHATDLGLGGIGPSAPATGDLHENDHLEGVARISPLPVIRPVRRPLWRRVAVRAAAALSFLTLTAAIGTVLLLFAAPA